MLKRGIFLGLLFLSGHFTQAQVTFVVEALPGATHSNDTLFLCGSFNGWNPNDKRYIVTKQLNGQLSITLPQGSGKIEYKFTRGSWNKVETDQANRLTANREFTYGNGKTVHVQIENWLDLGGARQMNYLIFYFFACAFQGIALCFLVSRVNRLDTKKFNPFIFMNGFMIIMLLLAVLHEIVNPIWQSYFVFVFHIAAFCWGPVMLLFLRAFSDNKVVSENNRLYFIPVVLASFVVLLRIINFSFLDFLSITIYPPLTLGNILFILTSFSFNLFIFIRALQLYPSLKFHRVSQRDERISFSYYFYWLAFLSLLIIPVNTLLIMNGFVHPFFEDFHIVGLALSALIFLEAYFLWRYPELIKEDRHIHINTDDNREWLEKLNVLMKLEKPYRHADLSVSDLADMLGTRPHVLSRVINDHYHKNFRDFVNAYRVEEFISLAHMQQYKHYTFLALAQEVGFNSKSTFNLAFKKLTQQNPREYFKTHA
jgi:AraC-like DNA-binding protein